MSDDFTEALIKLQPTKLRLQELERRYLFKLYEKTQANTRKSVNLKQFESELGLSDEEADILFTRLSDKNLAKLITFGNLIITQRGVDEVEAFMESTYAEKEYRVLHTIYEMGKNLSRNEVRFEDLKDALGMSFEDLNMVLDELYDRKKYLGNSSDGTLKLSPAGMEFLQGKHNFNQSGNPINYTTNIWGANYGNVQIGGEGNKQNITD